MYYFAPIQLYVLFAISVACYSITASRSPRYPSSWPIRLIGWFIPLLLLASWVPLPLHYVFTLFGSPTAMFIDPNILTAPSTLNDFDEICKYVAYHIHMVISLLFFFWIYFLTRARWDEQDGPSKEN